MSIRRVVAIVAVALVLSVSGTASAQTDSPQPAPTVSSSLVAATVGQGVTVNGEHFPTTSSVTVQLCGNEARSGSTDCDVVAGQTVVTNESGSFQAQVVVRFPPVPCPCVIWATSNGAVSASATAPIGIVTADYVNPPPPAEPAAPTTDLVVVRAALEQPQSWRGWFGLPVHAALVLTVRNQGPRAVDNVVLSLTVGKGTDPISVVSAPPIDSLAAGEERTITVPFELGAVAHGRYTIKGSFGAANVSFRAYTSVEPWGVALVVLLGAVVLLLRFRRRHLHDVPAVHDDAVAPVLEPVEPIPPIERIEPMRALVMNAGPSALPRAKVTFTFPDWSAARSVALCGDFNDWAPDAHPMERQPDGRWQVVVALKGPWSYRYRFLVDGDHWENDWAPDAFVENAYGTRDSVVLVGPRDRHADGSPPPPRRAPDEMSIDDDDDDDDLSSTFEEFWAEEPAPIRTKVRRWLR
jgi:hypothetical protein